MRAEHASVFVEIARHFSNRVQWTYELCGTHLPLDGWIHSEENHMRPAQRMAQLAKTGEERHTSHNVALLRGKLHSVQMPHDRS